LTEGPTQHNDRTRPLEREKEKIQRWSSRVPLWLTSHHPRCQPDLNAKIGELQTHNNKGKKKNVTNDANNNREEVLK